jgi:hypothetical protein
MRLDWPPNWFGRCPSPPSQIESRFFYRPPHIVVTILIELCFKHLLCLLCYRKSFLEICYQLVVINFTVRHDTYRIEELHFSSQNTTNPYLRILLSVQYACLMLKCIAQRDFQSVSSLNSSSCYYRYRSVSGLNIQNVPE